MPSKRFHVRRFRSIAGPKNDNGSKVAVPIYAGFAGRYDGQDPTIIKNPADTFNQSSDDRSERLFVICKGKNHAIVKQSIFTRLLLEIWVKMSIYVLM